MEKGEDKGIQKDDASSQHVHHTVTLRQEEPHTSRKRPASKSFTRCKGANVYTMSDDEEEEEETGFKFSKLEGANRDETDGVIEGANVITISDDEDEEEETGFKLTKSEEVSRDETDFVIEAANGEFSAHVVFALDYSSSVTKEELQKEINFVQHMAQSWNLSSECSKAALVVYGDDSRTVIPFDSDDDKSFPAKLGELKTETLFQSKCGRMDLALKEASKNLTAIKKPSQNQYQLVIMITAGKQFSYEAGKEDTDNLILSSELLYSSNVKVIIVPVGLETDFKELGLIVKRPQSLFPLSSFDDLTQDRAQEIASHIYKTIDNDVYAKKTLHTFAEIPTESTLWEKISLCSDVMEGAWYMLFDDQKKSRGPEKIKKLIRKSIDNFHNKLVSDSKICISVAVFGPLGAGKSFLLNFVLNQGLHEMYRVKSGPLPSASGGSQTPLPINIKWGKMVQVLLHKQEKSATPDIWFPEEGLGIGTLTRVKELLKMKFKDAGNFSDAKCVELQGPFPIFRFLKERSMTTSGHMELEVDVEFVDIPGRGDERGNQSIDTELSNADVVLFFEEGKSGRPASSEDIAQIFRRLEEVQFTSRPKLVHLVNDRRHSSSETASDFGLLQEQRREDLKRAWSSFLSSSIDQENRPGCYKDVREKLPQLDGEALLDKLSQESDVIYFHPDNPGFLDSLKKVINDHVRNVKIKETIHPFLKKVHWAAKKLRTRIGRSLTTEKKKSQPGKFEVKEPNFDMKLDADQVGNVVKNFIDRQNLPLQPDIRQMYCFLDSEETLVVLLDSLKESLEIFRLRLIEHFKNAYWSMSPDISDLVDLVENFCESRVEQYCANSAQTYLLYVVQKEKNRNPLKKLAKQWSTAGPEKKADLCVDFLYDLLQRIVVSLNKPTRDRKKEDKKTHFHIIEQLKEDVKDLFVLGSLDNSSRPEQLKILNKKLQIVIEFCTKSIREINPHPSLDVETDISLPEEMKDVPESKPIPLRPSYDAIIKDVTDLFKKPGFKGSDAIQKVKSKLSLGKDALLLRRPQSAEKQCLWAKALVNVLCDKEHFNIELDPSLTLDSRDAEIEDFLKQARKRLFAHEKSSITCKIVPGQALPDNEIHVKKRSQESLCLELLVSSEMSKKLDAIRNGLVDPMQQIAPIFMPTIRPGPSREIRGNFFLEEDPWSRDVRTDALEEDQSETVEEMTEEKRSNVLDLNIFLVVEKQHLKTVQSTVNALKVPTGRNMSYVVLPQKGRGIGVTRAIIKSLAECLDFSLYWTIDDDVQFMYQFDENDRKWHKCSLTRGLLFGQRVFQTCLKKTVKELSDAERFTLVTEMMQKCPEYGLKTKQSAMFLLADKELFAKVLKNPGLLHSPFAHISEDCGGDIAKEENMKAFEQGFVEKCRKLLFDDTINHIAGISIAHESTKRCDYMSKHPSADYMQSEQRYQVVLNNTSALKGMNFVTDDIIFHEDEDQVKDINKRNTPYWGVKGSDKSFCHALTVGGVIGYRVIRVVHSHKKLINVFDRVGPSYVGSQSPYRSEDEDEEDLDLN